MELTEKHSEALEAAKQTATMAPYREAHFWSVIQERERTRYAMNSWEEIKMLRQLMAVIEIYHKQIQGMVEVVEMVTETVNNIAVTIDAEVIDNK